MSRPCGIAVTQDGALLYVSDNSPRGSRKIWRCRLTWRGDVLEKTLLHDLAPGRGAVALALDARGHVWAAAGSAHRGKY